MSTTPITCESSILNFGFTGCMLKFGKIQKGFFWALKNSSGVANSLPFGTDLTETAVTAKLQSLDANDRWIMTDDLYNVEFKRDTPKFEAVDGIDFFLQDGKKPFKANIVRSDIAALKQYDSLKNGAMGFVPIDESGVALFKKIGNALYPWSINMETFYVSDMKKTSSATAKIDVNFTLKISEKDTDQFVIRVLDSDLKTSSILLSEGGLVDIYGDVVGTPTTTGATIRFRTDESGGTEYQIYEGTFVKTDLVAKVDGVEVTITTMTAGANNTWALVYPAVASGKSIVITQALAKTYSLKEFSIAIP